MDTDKGKEELGKQTAEIREVFTRKATLACHPMVAQVVAFCFADRDTRIDAKGENGFQPRINTARLRLRPKKVENGGLRIATNVPDSAAWRDVCGKFAQEYKTPGDSSTK